MRTNNVYVHDIWMMSLRYDIISNYAREGETYPESRAGTEVPATELPAYLPYGIFDQCGE